VPLRMRVFRARFFSSNSQCCRVRAKHGGGHGMPCPYERKQQDPSSVQTAHLARDDNRYQERLRKYARRLRRGKSANREIGVPGGNATCWTGTEPRGRV